MSKGLRTNLILLVILLVGGLAVWLADHQQQQAQTEEEASRAISALTPDAVVRAEFRPRGQAPITLEKGDGGWTITEPRPLVTDAAAVTRLFTLLGGHFARQVDAPDPHPADYGLDDPEAILTAYPAEGAPVELLLGGKAPTGSQRYLRLGGEGPIVLVPDYEVGGLSQTLNDLRNKELGAGLGGAELARIELVNGENRRVLTRDEADNWLLVEPIQDRASGNRVRYWLNGLRHARATGFQDAAPPETPGWTVTFTPVEGEPVAIPLWWSGEALMAKRAGDPDAMVMAPLMITALNKAVLELVDLAPLPAQTDIAQLTLTPAEGESLSVQKGEEGWPSPVWEAFEEAVNREAAEARPIERPGAILFTLTVGEGENAIALPFWKAGEVFVMAPPDRAVTLALTPLQSQALQGALDHLLAPPQAEEPAPTTDASGDGENQAVSDQTAPPMADAPMADAPMTPSTPTETEAVAPAE